MAWTLKGGISYTGSPSGISSTFYVLMTVLEAEHLSNSFRMMVMIVEDQKQFYCIHCRKPFKNWHALVSHLKFCKKRKLRRLFDCLEYRFIIHLNPRHRIMDALKQLQSEYAAQPKVFLGAVPFLQNASLIDSFEILPMREDLNAEDLYY